MKKFWTIIAAHVATAFLNAGIMMLLAYMFDSFQDMTYKNWLCVSLIAESLFRREKTIRELEKEMKSKS